MPIAQLLKASEPLLAGELVSISESGGVALATRPQNGCEAWLRHIALHSTLGYDAAMEAPEAPQAIEFQTTISEMLQRKQNA